ncbi:hypothetical protein [Methylobacterium trifolii]|uniref:Uncharacterized protein n=1 Tax=Methylobacterium trifolii TaxID=1003092 RepID=A0ABQ4TUX9_9HYPH|nr:hypothetical protein [Methylobacterium trifolii]GJE58871.1 hypothetical protein MPOCJGCO_0956 [Methylobacterium trifolii]
MKVLTLSTYRTDLPRHGGQVRLAAIQRVLRSQGWTIRHMPVYVRNADDLPEDSAFLFPFDPDFHRRLEETQGRSDVDAADFLLGDPSRFAAACDLIDGYDPDCIWLEQPWLWPFVKVYLAGRSGSRARVVYGSQNVETHLIENVIRKLPKRARERIRATAEAMERDLCAVCDGIVAVSRGDLAFFQAYGKPSVLAANGVWPKGQRSGVDYWRKEASLFSTAMFVSSAHPPNATGFVEMLGDNLAYLAPDERIIVVGGVIKLLEGPGFYGEHRGLNLSRLIAAGVQDEGGLSTILDVTKGVLLPIKEGGGTNLKTAEALNNRKPIVATTAAMRGFEEFSDFPGVTIRDDPAAFRAAVKALLATEARGAPDYTAEQERMLDTLLWPATLGAIPSFLEGLSAGRIGGPPLPGLLPGPETARAATAPVRVWSEYQLRPLLARGWHDFEPAGTWSRERNAALRIRFPEEARGAVHLRIAMEVFNPQKRPIDIEIFTPGGHQATHRFRGGDRQRSVAIRIDETDRDGSGMTEVYFRSSALFSPISSSRSDDARLLGFRVTAIEVSQDPLPGSRPSSPVRSALAGAIGRMVDRLR